MRTSVTDGCCYRHLLSVTAPVASEAFTVRESGHVLQLIRDLRDKGLAVILVSHDMPQVFEVSDRIHIQRLGRRAAVVTPQSHSMSDAVAIMTGASLG